jgi:hypothetical protein
MSEYNAEKELLITITKSNIQEDNKSTLQPISSKKLEPYHSRAQSKLERFRSCFKGFVEKYELDKTLDVLELVFSLYFFATFIFCTYQTEVQEWVYISELCVANFFFIDWKWRGMFLSDQKLRFLFSKESLVDLATIFPVIPTSSLLQRRSLWFEWGPSFWRLIFALRAIRIHFKGKRFLRQKFLPLSLVQKRVLETYLFIFSLLLFAASIIIATPWLPTIKQFHDALYWILLMATTIGSPEATLVMGKLLILMFVVGLIVIVPMAIVDITSVLNRSSRFGGSYISSRCRSFVLICGAIEYPAIRDLLNELLYSDHKAVRVSHAILLAPKEPSDDLEAQILKNKRYASSVTYLNGSVLSTKDLVDRVHIRNAKAVFILCNSHGDPNEEDAATVCRILTIRSVAPSVKIIVEVRNPQNKFPVELAGATHAVCTHELQLALLGQSCVCPGFSTLVTNLTKAWVHQPPFSSTSSAHHFDYGLGQKMYETKLSRAFCGINYFQLAEVLYTNFHLTLVALRKDNVFVSPIGPSNSVYVVTGNEHVLVIALDQISVNKISETSSVKKDGSFDVSNLEQNNKDRENDEIIDSSFDEENGQVKLMPLDNTNSNVKSTRERRTITTAFLRNVSTEVRDHIVVCVSSLTPDLVSFVLPLRSNSNTELLPIVFLTQQIPDENVWQSFASFPEIWIVQGTPYVRGDLMRINAHLARCIVLLNYGRTNPMDFQHRSDQQKMEESILDDAVTLMNFITLDKTLSKNPNVFVLANLKNSFAIPLMSRERVNLDMHNFVERDIFFSPVYAAGKVHNVSLLSAFLSQRFYNSHLMDEIESFARGQIHKVSLVALPQGFEKSCYIDLVTYLTKKQMVPLGLYCASSPTSGELPYVYVSPPPNTPLHSHDRIYVFDFSSQTVSLPDQLTDNNINNNIRNLQ